ncbi:MAG: DUF805 domain-containing protein [Sphingomonadaceae bacterium]
MALMFQPIRKYATFSGRARRLEYWLWQLFVAAVTSLLLFWLLTALGNLPPLTGDQAADQAAVSAAMAASPGATLPAFGLIAFSLFVFLPSLAVSVRRLHDSGKSGWWILLGLTAIGSLVLLIFFLLDGTRGPNRFGPDPKGRVAPTG